MLYSRKFFGIELAGVAEMAEARDSNPASFTGYEGSTPSSSTNRRQQRSLLVFFVHGDRFQVFGFNNHTAVEAVDIIDTVTPGNKYSAVVLADGRYRLRGLHKADYGFILTMSLNLSSQKINDFC